MPKRPIVAAAFSQGDAIIVLDADGIYADDHPWVQSHPELFKDLEIDIIEQATAAPGETRKAAKPK